MKLQSPIDSIIIDMILDHYNIQSATGKKESLSGDDFQEIVEIYLIFQLKEQKYP